MRIAGLYRGLEREMKRVWFGFLTLTEGYDYGQYGEAGYDDGSGMIDPNTGMPIQAADGNKGWSNFFILVL